MGDASNDSSHRRGFDFAPTVRSIQAAIEQSSIGHHTCRAFLLSNRARAAIVIKPNRRSPESGSRMRLPQYLHVVHLRLRTLYLPQLHPTRLFLSIR